MITAWGTPKNKKRGFFPPACRKHPSGITLRTLSTHTLYIAGTILTLNYLTWAIFPEGSRKFPPHLGPVSVLAFPISFFLLCDTPKYSRDCITTRQHPTVLDSSSSGSSSTSHTFYRTRAHDVRRILLASALLHIVRLVSSRPRSLCWVIMSRRLI